jgi:bifunctional DNase/RNase
MIEVVVQHLGVDPTSNSPVVVLREKDGQRFLPIWIGPAEANAIAIKLQDVPVPRPMTHDLLARVVTGLGGTLRRVFINSVKENTYYAEMVIDRDDHVFQIDARPSDSIALALRLQAPIFTEDRLLNDPVEEDDAIQPDPALSAELLKQRLEKLDPQDFGRFNP